MTAPDIRTARLHIRALREEDLPALADLWTDPQVMLHLGGPREREWLLNALREDLGPEAPRFNLWPVAETATGRVVGHCGILEKQVEGRDEHELVYVLVRHAWGRGLATEAAAALRDHAFASMGLDRLVSLIEPGNAASERVARKVGMKLESETVRPGGRVMKVYAAGRPALDGAGPIVTPA
jgi:RimJ/RimL family protein N-acetyltransferase